MKFIDDHYRVEISVSKENAREVLVWLDSLGQKLRLCESALASEPRSLPEAIKMVEEYAGNAGFIMEFNFKDEETALLAEMKYA